MIYSIRFIAEFNENYEFIIITLFMFSLLSLTCSLMVILSQTVEYLLPYLMNEPIVNFFIWICCRQFSLKSDQNAQPVEMIFTVILLITSFSAIFFFCEFGEMVSNQLNIFDVELSQCDWYTFPNDVQRLLLTFMSITQQSTGFRGYANTQCTRDAFKSVRFDSIKRNVQSLKIVTAMFAC